MENLYQTKKDEFTNKSIKFIYEQVKNEKGSHGDAYSHDKFFKESATNDTLKNHILEKIG